MTPERVWLPKPVLMLRKETKVFDDDVEYVRADLLAKAETRAVDITREQAGELQDILHTLTDSGVALTTSARELVAAFKKAEARIKELEGRLASLEATEARVKELEEVSAEYIARTDPVLEQLVSLADAARAVVKAWDVAVTRLTRASRESMHEAERAIEALRKALEGKV